VNAGSPSSSTTVYEDDGTTTAYLSPQNTLTATASVSRDDTAVKFSVTFSSGGYEGMATMRTHQLRIVGETPPSSVSINGVDVDFVRHPTAKVLGEATSSLWWYDATSMAVVVHGVVPTSINQGWTVVVVFSSSLPGVSSLADNSYLSGIASAVRRASLGKPPLDDLRVVPGSHSTRGGAVDVLSNADSVCVGGCVWK